MNREHGTESAVLRLFHTVLLMLFAGAVGSLIGLVSAERELAALTVVICVTLLALILLLLPNYRTAGMVGAVPIREILRWGFVIMLPAAIVGPVASWPGLRSAYAFRLLYVAVSFGFVTWLLVQRRFVPTIKISGFLTFLVFWLGWATVSLAWAADKVAGIRYLVFLVMMISLTIGTVLAVNSLKLLRVALAMLLLTFVASIGVGLLEIITDFRLPTSGLIGAAARFQWLITSFFYNPNNFATYITLWLPFLVTLPFFTRRVTLVAPSAVCAFLSIVCLMRTGSRLNLLALILVALSLLLALAVRRGLAVKWRQVGSGLVILLVGALAVYSSLRGASTLLQLPETGVEAWQFSTLVDQITAETGSVGTRTSLMTHGLTALAHSGLLGVGPGNAEYHVQRMPGAGRVSNLHNWWLEVLVNTGIFVFAGYAFFYLALLYNLFQIGVKAKNQVLAYAGVSLFVALVGYTLGALAPSSAIHFAPMWIHFGLALAVVNLHRQRLVQGEA